MRRILSLVLFLTAGAAGAARADDGVIRDPQWRYWPSQDDLNRDFPQKANEKNIPGHVRVRCVGGPDGHLQNCVVLEETPVDFGFGEAALKSAAQPVLAPKTSDGRPTAGATVEFVLDYYYENRYARTMIYGPRWDATPTHEDMAKAWASLPPNTPPGRVVFSCDIETDGHLGHCLAVSSIPADTHYEAAAQPLLAKFHVTELPPPIPGGYRVALPVRLRQPDPPPADPNQVQMIANPRWVHTPTPQQSMQYYPAKAAAAGVDQGKAGLECQVNTAGMLTNCEVVAEEPKGLDFGAAALNVSKLMGVGPWTSDGQPVEGAYIDLAVTLQREVKGAGASAQDKKRP